MAKSCETVRLTSVKAYTDSVIPGQRTYKVVLERPSWDGYTVGQFAMLRPTAWTLDMLWGRPLSIADMGPDGLEFFMAEVGRGTKSIAELPIGSPIVVWGALGRGFRYKPDEKLLVLAGGAGIAPFLGLSRKIDDPSRIRMLFGARLASECYPYDEMTSLCHAEYYPDQKPGDIDRFVAAIEAALHEEKDARVLACGPTPFLRSIKRLADGMGKVVQLSLENRMACGVGACLGCVTTPAKADEPPVRVCMEGPVFDSNEITL